MGTNTVKSGEHIDRQSRILEAALDLLSRHGISGVNMRAVAREAGVALGLVNYYYDDKTSLIRAALHRVDEHDLQLVASDPSSAPDEQLRKALRRVAGAELLTTRYLSLRLHLWALAQADEGYADIMPPPSTGTSTGWRRSCPTQIPGLSLRNARSGQQTLSLYRTGCGLRRFLA